MDRFWATLLVVPVFIWFSFHTALDRDFKIKQQRVENVVYQYTQVAAKKGVMYASLYDEMQQRLRPLGTFEVYVTAEKFTGNNVEPTVITNANVIGRDLRAEGYDIVNVYVRSVNEHPLGKILRVTPWGGKIATPGNTRLYGQASVYIQ